MKIINEENWTSFIKKVYSQAIKKNDYLSTRLQVHNQIEGFLLELLLLYPENSPGEYTNKLNDEYGVNVSFEQTLDILRKNFLNTPERRLQFTNYIKQITENFIATCNEKENKFKKIYEYIIQSNFVTDGEAKYTVRLSKKMFLLSLCQRLIEINPKSKKFLQDVNKFQDTICETKAGHCIELVYLLYKSICQHKQVEYRKLDLLMISGPVQRILEDYDSPICSTQKDLDSIISQRDALENCLSSLEILKEERQEEEEKNEWHKIIQSLIQPIYFNASPSSHPTLKLRRIIDVCFYYQQCAREQKKAKEGKSFSLALQNISLFLQYIDFFPMYNWKIFDEISEKSLRDTDVIYENSQGEQFAMNNIQELGAKKFIILSPGWLWKKRGFSVQPIVCFDGF